MLSVGEEGSDSAHKAAVRMWALIFASFHMGRGWDRSYMGCVVANVEALGPALVTCQCLPVLS